MSHIAYTYARAFKDSFEKEKSEDFFSCVKELSQLRMSLQQLDIEFFFLSPAVSVEQKKQVLERLFKSLGFNNMVLSFLFLLLDRKRWKLLNSILEYLLSMEKEMKGVISVEVQSVHNLDSELKEQLIKKWEQVFNKKVLLKEKPPSQELIGGIKILSKGLVLNDTLLFHLTQMENQIRRNFYDYTGK